MPTGGDKTTLSIENTFQPSSSLFGPGTPLIPPDPQPVRRIDFPAGVNLQWTPRGYEPFDFPHLRSFSNVELVRLAIETRKDQIERLDWQIKVKKGRKKGRVDAEERIRSVERFLARPDGVTPFASWMRVLVDDMLSIDAATIELRKTRSGKLIGLDYVDGSTIKVLVDSTGRLPRAPAPAYQQIIKGKIWNSLTTDDILYLPRNIRPGKMYGFSPVEQIIVTINTLLRRQTQQLAYFTDGNVPQGIINCPEGWTPDQVKEFQDGMDAILAGNLANRAKIIWAPFGSKYQAFKEPPIKDEFDEWLARIVSFSFSLPPTPFIRQMNRGTAQEDQDRAIEEGLLPLLLWAKRFLDWVIQDALGFSDLEFEWDTSRDLDPEKQSRVDDVNLRNGSVTLNEVRDNRGLEPYPFGNEPMVYTATGVIKLEDSIELSVNPPDTGKNTGDDN